MAKLNKGQKAIVCVAVAQGFRGEVADALNCTVDQAEVDKLSKLTVAELDPTFEKALVVMAQPEAKEDTKEAAPALSDEQKIAICCHINSGVRLHDEAITLERMVKMAATPIKMEQVAMHREMSTMTPAEVEEVFVNHMKALQAESTNHLNKTPAEMTQAKADGKIVYTPVKGEDGLYQTSDGQKYTKDRTGAWRRFPPVKETKREKRLRRRAERLAAGKQR